MAEIRIGVHDTLADLVAWARRAQALDKNLDAMTRKVAQDGNRAAKSYARKTAGKHGRRYPSAFSVGKLAPGVYVYGPTADKAQGGMSFEEGSRNQPRHGDLAKSADGVSVALVDGVRDEIRKVLAG